jgi:Kef-type K+ transport system membrane component KefB
VIGEVLAGILLGPSLIGLELSARILPPSIAPILGIIAQTGVILYMFLVGLELDTATLRSRRRSTALIAWAGILVPFGLGAAIAPLYAGLAPEGTTRLSFTLFMGIALSVTAFPVLARILKDRAMERTELGVIALGAAAMGDLVTWCLLAAIVGLTHVHVSSLAIVGAFLLGVMIPARRRIVRLFGSRVRAVITMILLPAFFAFTGMRTRIDLVRGGEAWLLCGLIVLIAVAGKFGGTLAGARLARIPWRESAILGVLMNTRGLMELIVLNIGLELGIISPPLFAMMVLMALATTMMTGPLLKRLNYGSRRTAPSH